MSNIFVKGIFYTLGAFAALAAFFAAIFFIYAVAETLARYAGVSPPQSMMAGPLFLAVVAAVLIGFGVALEDRKP